MNVLELVLAVVVVIFVMYRRMIGEVVQVKRLLLVPVVLTVIGIVRVAAADSGGAGAVGLLVATSAFSVVLGLARGATVHLEVRNGLAWMRYRVVTLVLWAVNIGVRLAVIPLVHVVAPGSSSTSSILLTLGLSLLAECLVVVFRAQSFGGRVLWAKGRNGGQNLYAQDVWRRRGR